MSERYAELTSLNLQWEPPTLESASEAVCIVDGQRMIMLSANNYLNLTTHPKVVAAMVEATKLYGAGSGSVRALSGTMSIHLEAEAKVPTNFQLVQLLEQLILAEVEVVLLNLLLLV